MNPKVSSPDADESGAQSLYICVSIVPHLSKIPGCVSFQTCVCVHKKQWQLWTKYNNEEKKMTEVREMTLEQEGQRGSLACQKKQTKKERTRKNESVGYMMKVGQSSVKWRRRRGSIQTLVFGEKHQQCNGKISSDRYRWVYGPKGFLATAKPKRTLPLRRNLQHRFVVRLLRPYIAICSILIFLPLHCRLAIWWLGCWMLQWSARFDCGLTWNNQCASLLQTTLYQILSNSPSLSHSRSFFFSPPQRPNQPCGFS